VGMHDCRAKRCADAWEKPVSANIENKIYSITGPVNGKLATVVQGRDGVS